MQVSWSLAKQIDILSQNAVENPYAICRTEAALSLSRQGR